MLIKRTNPNALSATALLKVAIYTCVLLIVLASQNIAVANPVLATTSTVSSTTSSTTTRQTPSLNADKNLIESTEQSKATDENTQAIAQNDTIAQANSISQLIMIMEGEIVALKKGLAQPPAIEKTQLLITSLPINADNIEQHLSDLTNQTTPIKPEQIDEIAKKQEQISTHIQFIKNQQVEAERYSEQLSELQTQQESLKQLLNNPANSANISEERHKKFANFQHDIKQIKQQLAENKQAIDQQLEQLQASHKLLTRLHSALQLHKQKQKQNKTTSNQENIQLSQQALQLRKEITELQTQFDQHNGSIDFVQADKNQREIYEKSLQLWLIGIDKSLIQIIEKLSIDFTGVSLEDMSFEELQTRYAELLVIKRQMNQLTADIDSKETELKKYSKILGKQSAVAQMFNQRKQSINYQSLQLQKQLSFFSDEIAIREERISFSVDKLYGKHQFIQAITGLPNALQQVGYQIAVSFQGLLAYISLNPLMILLTSALVCLFVFSVTKMVLYLINRFMPNKQTESRTFHLLVTTVKKYFHLLMLMLFVIYLVKASELPHLSSDIILTLIYGITIAFIWLTILRIDEPLPEKRKSRLIRTVATVSLALFSMFYFIAKLCVIDSMVLSLSEKVLMLSLIAFVWLEREKYSQYLSLEQSAKSKLYKLYNGFLKIMPWLIIATAMMSLIGFSHLAWETFNDIWELLIYIALLTVGFKVISYIRDRAQSYSRTHLKHGLFIALHIISPLSVIIKYVWIVCVSLISFIRLDLSTDSYPVADFLLLIEKPLVTIGTTEINIQMIVFALLSVYLVFKFAHWLKIFSYHVIYARIQDFGVRQSLSIFTQYIMAVIGVLLVLSILGIDLTSLAVFAGALGVGVGLGLQDIAKNFISGIILLIERPLRNGDWVTLDNYEGTVKNIGMRAIVMETFDKQDVIIPNANAISNSFTNNTHSNALLRTVLYIGADYDSNPDTVVNILMTIMENNADIVSDPSPKTVLWEYGDSSINYRIQYYVNTECSNLFDVRNAVLKEVWHTFKEANIGIPYPQRDVHIHKVTD